MTIEERIEQILKKEIEEYPDWQEVRFLAALCRAVRNQRDIDLDRQQIKWYDAEALRLAEEAAK